MLRGFTVLLLRLDIDKNLSTKVFHVLIKSVIENLMVICMKKIVMIIVMDIYVEKYCDGKFNGYVDGKYL